MSRLSRDARALIDEARAEEDPTALQEERVRAELGVRLGAAAFVSLIAASATTARAGATAATTSVAVGASGASALFAILGKSMLVGALLGAGATAALGDRPTPPLITSEAGSRSRVIAGKLARDQVPGRREITQPVEDAPGPAQPSPTHAGRRRPAEPPPAARTVEPTEPDPRGELGLGHPDRALQRLDEHIKSFADGTLQEERRAARVVALCKAGRAAEARAEAERFLRESPDSPLATRVRTACPSR